MMRFRNRLTKNNICNLLFKVGMRAYIINTACFSAEKKLILSASRYLSGLGTNFAASEQFIIMV